MEIPVLDEPRFLSTNPIPTRGILMASSASTNDARAPCMCHLLKKNTSNFQMELLQLLLPQRSLLIPGPHAADALR